MGALGEEGVRQALAQGLQVRVEAAGAIELGCKGLPPPKRQLLAGAPRLVRGWERRAGS